MFKSAELLEELIRLPSVNPAFLPAGHVRAGEHRVAEYLGTQARRAGLDVKFQRVLPGRSNLMVQYHPPGKVRQRILLAPHLDTVGAAENQFTPRRHHQRLYGRGACDTKGSVAAMFSALCDLVQSRRRPAHTQIVFAGLIDEENVQAGSRALVRSRFKADLAIVGEPTRLQVVTAHKGSLWLELRTAGKAAHGARPELGRNAVHQMARAVDVIENRYAQKLRARRHPLLGPGTVSVGLIRGGTQANIVPDECMILIDRRTLPGESETKVVREMRSLLRRYRVRALFSNGKHAPCLPLETNPKLPLVAQFLHSMGQKRPVGAHYFCDASVLAHGGIPSVVFGPGDIAQAHTTDEWISLRSLERGQALLLRFLQSLC